MAHAAQGWFHPWPGDLRSPSCLRPVPVAWSSPERPGCGRWGPASPCLQLPQPSGSGHRESAGSAGFPSVGLGPGSGTHRGHGAERGANSPGNVNLGCPPACSHWEAWLCPASLWALEPVLAVHTLRTLVWSQGGVAGLRPARGLWDGPRPGAASAVCPTELGQSPLCPKQGHPNLLLEPASSGLEGHPCRTCTLEPREGDRRPGTCHASGHNRP